MKRITVATILWMGAAAGAAQPSADAVGFPRSYALFEQVRTITVKRDPSHGTVFLNAAAAAVSTPPYAPGSVMVMEWRRGGPQGEIARLDVMQKGQSEWAYASYAPDGKLLTGPAEALACAQCHAKAGAAKDFVYAGRFASGAR